MNNEVKILIVEDDDGHASLIEKNLRRSGIQNEFIRFKDGKAILDFFYKESTEYIYKPNDSYLLLLDIRMPKLSGFDVLEKLKSDSKFKKIPIIMLTTTDNPDEINKCHTLGCNSYITKPVEYIDFISVIKQLGLFITITEIPKLGTERIISQ